jgi:hypothetical protein
MTQDDILRIAREADVWVAGQRPYQTQLERFADRILEHIAYDDIHTCNAQRPACVREAVKAEREACAKVVEQYTGAWDDQGYALAQSIRNRGEK